MGLVSLGARPGPARHALPAAGFGQPFELLEACHGRVQRSLRLLLRLGRHLARHGVDRQAIDAAADVQRYFSIAAPLHHEDEERHLLPLLRSDPDPAMVRLAGRLLRDHAWLQQAWVAISADLQQVGAGRLPGAGSVQPSVALEAARQRWRMFSARYRRHIRLEESIAFPHTRGGLDAAALAAIGTDMARRRGVGSASL